MELRQHTLKTYGFSLVEVLVVVGIVAGLATYGWVTIAQSRTRTVATRAGEETVSAVREVQNWAMAAHAGRGWGLRCDNGILTRFSFTDTQPMLDQTVLPMRTGFTCDMNPGEVKFSKLTGIPFAAPVNLTVVYGGQALKRIMINGPGVITLNSI